MNTLNFIFALALIGSATQAVASEDLAKGKNCFGCHSVANKMVGPAFKEVAAKYKGDKKAAATLAAKVKAGGVGAWGQIPMPPNNVSDAESKQLVNWILGLK